MAEPPQLLVELEDNPDTHEYPLCLDRPSTLKVMPLKIRIYCDTDGG